MDEKNWHKYFMNIAKAVSMNSKCYSRQIGAILVKDKSIISTGYNGPSRNIKHCIKRDGTPGCPRKEFKDYISGSHLDICPAGHAERNAIVNAARIGIVTVKNSTMYCYCPIPCKDCLIEIINAGINTIIATSDVFYDKLSKRLIKESNINMYIFDDIKGIQNVEIKE